MTAALLALATRGTVRTETLRAFNESEMEQILQSRISPSLPLQAKSGILRSQSKLY
jgi:hypothetical protein